MLLKKGKMKREVSNSGGQKVCTVTQPVLPSGFCHPPVQSLKDKL